MLRMIVIGRRLGVSLIVGCESTPSLGSRTPAEARKKGGGLADSDLERARVTRTGMPAIGEIGAGMH